MRAWIELSFTSITSFCDFYRGSFSSVCILLKSKSKHTCNFSLPHQLTQLRPQTGRLSATQSTTNLQLAPQQQQTPVSHLNLIRTARYRSHPPLPESQLASRPSSQKNLSTVVDWSTNLALGAEEARLASAVLRGPTDWSTAASSNSTLRGQPSRRPSRPTS